MLLSSVFIHLLCPFINVFLKYVTRLYRLDSAEKTLQ